MDRVVEPFLHVDARLIYNPLTGAALPSGDPLFPQVMRLRSGNFRAGELSDAHAEALASTEWLVDATAGAATGRRFRLKYAALEANTACNQACHFCPVSTDPRPGHSMSMELYERIVVQLAAHAATLEGVSMIQYNEPTVDSLFLDRLLLLKSYGLPPAVNTNATGLTPARVDRIVEAGGIRFLSVNLSTIDRQRYAATRGSDHLAIVLRNIDYAATLSIAARMEIVVLGLGDGTHQADYAEIQRRYSGSKFDVKYAVVMDRAGSTAIGSRPDRPIRRLRGCEQTGSRPLEWIHILPDATCVFCCQDYHSRYVIGDLTRQSLDEVLTGPEIAKLRRWAYGLEEAPDDFICRHCVFAREA